MVEKIAKDTMVMEVQVVESGTEVQQLVQVLQVKVIMEVQGITLVAHHHLLVVVEVVEQVLLVVTLHKVLQVQQEMVEMVYLLVLQVEE